jgi:CubicO group peptidase (beta-lactamase class C family)
MTKTRTANLIGNWWRTLVLAATATALLTTACSTTATADAKQLQPWRDFDAYLQQTGFSGTALVVKYGRSLLGRGYGAADRTRGVLNAPRTRFCIASMGKMFTAVAIAQLVQQGAVSFTDTIGEYLGGFPADVADTVTIADLLTHTSGLGDVALGTPSPPHTLAGTMARIVKEPLQFEPGSRFSYSNDGFIVLGAIIEQVTGLSYADYVRGHIFQPRP